MGRYPSMRKEFGFLSMSSSHEMQIHLFLLLLAATLHLLKKCSFWKSILQLQWLKEEFLFLWVSCSLQKRCVQLMLQNLELKYVSMTCNFQRLSHKLRLLSEESWSDWELLNCRKDSFLFHDSIALKV